MLSTIIQAAIGADNTKLRSDATETEGIFGKLGSRITTLWQSVGAALTAGAVIGFFKSVADHASRVQDAADRLQVGTDAFQSFSYAVTQAGGTTDDAARIFGTAKLKLDELAAGNDATTKSFGTLHLKAADFKGLSLEQSMEKIAAASAKYGHEAGATAAANDILGKTGSKLSVVIERLGTDGFQKLTADARAAGQVIEGETLGKIDKLGDHMATLKGAATTLGASILGAVVSFSQGVGEFAAKVVNDLERIPTVHENIAEKATRIGAAHEVVQLIVRGTKATVEELEKSEKSLAKQSDDAALAKLSGLQKITALEEKIVQLNVAKSRYDGDTIEYLDIQNRLLETQGKLDTERKKIAEDVAKSTSEHAKAARLDRDQQLEFLRLQMQGVSNLTSQEAARFDQLKLIAREKQLAVQIDALLERGVDNLTKAEGKKLAELIKQTDRIGAQILAKQTLIEAAIAQAKGEGHTTEELEKQLSVLTKQKAIKSELDSTVRNIYGRSDKDLSDRELEEKRGTLKKNFDAAQAANNSISFVFGRDLDAVEFEKSRRSQFRRDYSREGEKAFTRYSAFEEQTLRSYIRPEDEKRAQLSLETLQSIDARLRAVTSGG